MRAAAPHRQGAEEQQNQDADATRTADAYRGTYERLRQIKAKYDPDSVFHVNRYIPPGG
jgi:FAD/FMN-containing dehydrogenase